MEVTAFFRERIKAYRFNTGFCDTPDGLILDTDLLFENLLLGIKNAFETFHEIESLAIDTFAIDTFVSIIFREIATKQSFRRRIEGE